MNNKKIEQILKRLFISGVKEDDLESLRQAYRFCQKNKIKEIEVKETMMKFFLLRIFSFYLKMEDDKENAQAYFLAGREAFLLNDKKTSQDLFFRAFELLEKDFETDFVFHELVEDYYVKFLVDFFSSLFILAKQKSEGNNISKKEVKKLLERIVARYEYIIKLLTDRAQLTPASLYNQSLRKIKSAFNLN